MREAKQAEAAMPDNEIIAAMTDKARERLIATYRGGIQGWEADEFRDSMQAALRAALETAGVTPEQVEFALGDALRPFYANKMNPEETALFKAIRAAYPASQSEGE